MASKAHLIAEFDGKIFNTKQHGPLRVVKYNNHASVEVKPLSKSLIITIVGYITGVIGQVVLYPLFGLTVTIGGILSLGLLFCVIALVTNYCSLKAIEYFESK